MNNQETNRIQRFSWKMSPALHKEIENHFFVLKNLFNQKILKQKWFLDAVIEKLRKEENQQYSGLNSQERLGLRIDPLTSLKLDERVKKTRKHHWGYSKQKLILEAIQEKLSIEEENVKQKISEQRLLLNELRDRK